MDRRYWQELRSVGGLSDSLKSAYDNVVKAKDLAEAEVVKVKADAAAELARVLEDAGRLVQEAEEKAKAVVGSETARLQVEYDQKLKKCLGKAKEEAVMAYRRDRGRAVEQATVYVDGGVYILGKIAKAFPEHDWSKLPAPELTEDMVDDEHEAILAEIDKEIAGGPETQQQKE